MNAIQIDGKVVAETVRARIARDVAFLQTQCNVIPGLAVVLVGSDPASCRILSVKPSCWS